MQTFNSFAELARVYGCKVKAQERMAHGTFLTVQEKCGHKAAILWSVLQDREACKRYGDKGKIILTPTELADITGYAESSVIGCLMTLINNRFIRLTTDGQAVKAA